MPPAVVYKYPIDINGITEIPCGFADQALSVAFQGPDLCVWVLHHDDIKNVVRTHMSIEARMTGERFEWRGSWTTNEWASWTTNTSHLGTVERNGIVVHVFVTPPNQRVGHVVGHRPV